MDRVLDLNDQEVVVGDTIAYAVVQGRSANLRIGKITEIVWAHNKYNSWDHEMKYPTKVPTKLRVAVDKSSFGRGPEKPTLIEAGFKRFVKMPETPDA